MALGGSTGQIDIGGVAGESGSGKAGGSEQLSRALLVTAGGDGRDGVVGQAERC